jgi:DNA-binding beta-propeller fold protein YncE
MDSYISTMVSVMGNVQQLSSYDSSNPPASHAYLSGEQPAAAPLSTQSSSFWDFLASAFGLGDIVQTGNSLLSEKAAFLSPSFNPNDPAVAGVMAWLAQNPDYEAACSPDLADDPTCRAVIWPYYAESPSAGLLVAAAKSATTAGISEGTGLAEDGTGDLISNQADLSPVANWALDQGIGVGTDYFVDNYVSSSGRQMLIFGDVSSGQTTVLPNGSHNIILATGTSETPPTGFPVPSITTLTPSSLLVGATPQTLTINGTNFLSSSTVTFNGIVHTPTYVSTSQIKISLTSSDLAVSGSYPVVIANPGAIGTLSAAATFWVTTGPTADTVPVGSDPTAIAVNSLTNTIYVANYGSNNITVINGTDNTTVTVPLPYAPWAVAVNAVTNKVYVSGGYEVTVIDGATNNTTSIPLSATATNGGLYGIAINSSTNMIYVVDYYDDTTIINGSDFSNTTLTGLGGPGFFYPFVVVNPIANQIYVPYIAPGREVGSVTAIDGESLKTTSVGVGMNPSSIAVNPLTKHIYVANWWSGDVTIINTDDWSTVTVSGGPDAGAVAVNLITGMTYVADNDPADNSTTFTIPGSSIGAVAINPTTNKIYFTNPTYAPPTGVNNTVVVLDGATNSTTSITVGNSPAAIAVNPVTNRVYVANSGSNTVTVIGPE